VEIAFRWADEPTVAISDDGRGMSQDALAEAMRFGRDPRDIRDETDLGRFGLGLKTASLSQAGVLTVVSKADQVPACAAQWDIDHVSQTDQWDLAVGAPAAFGADLPPTDTGTTVIWSKLDRKIAADVDVFLGVAEAVGRHLGMVFHRFIAAGCLSISVNGLRALPWDPFGGELGERISTTELAGGAVRLQGYLLPPPGNLSEEDERRLAGPQDWLEQQGFYVYRQDRLLVTGGWLGLGRTGRAWSLDRKHSLARISVDFANDQDAMWSIDVLKTVATPPEGLRYDLVRFADGVRRRAAGRRNQVIREAKAVAAAEAGGATLWVAQPGAMLGYRVNRRHPLVISARQAIADAAVLRSLLEALERTAPVYAARSAPVGEDDVAAARRAETESGVTRLVRILYPNLRAAGLSPDAARGRLLEQHSMREHEGLIDGLVETLEEEREARL
jgi:hypothetical protein